MLYHINVIVFLLALPDNVGTGRRSIDSVMRIGALNHDACHFRWNAEWKIACVYHGAEFFGPPGQEDGKNSSGLEIQASRMDARLYYVLPKIFGNRHLLRPPPSLA